MGLRFAMVTDTHVGLTAASAQRLGLVYAAIARLGPAFVLHCGDVTDTGLPGEYERYEQAVPAALRGRIRHVAGNHDVRWDPSAKELYRVRLRAAPPACCRTRVPAARPGGPGSTAISPPRPGRRWYSSTSRWGADTIMWTT